jgi:hypothetical protein
MITLRAFALVEERRVLSERELCKTATIATLAESKTEVGNCWTFSIHNTVSYVLSILGMGGLVTVHSERTSRRRGTRRLSVERKEVVSIRDILESSGELTGKHRVQHREHEYI